MTKAGTEITPAHETQITLFATSCILAEDITANVLKGCRPSAKSLQRFNELASIQRRLLVSLGIFNRMSGDDNPEQELTEQQLDEMESLQEIIAKYEIDPLEGIEKYVVKR